MNKEETYTFSQMLDRIASTAFITIMVMVIIQLIISSTVYTKPSTEQRLHSVCDYLHGEVHGDICLVNGKETSTRG